jgi:hypothetical protein
MIQIYELATLSNIQNTFQKNLLLLQEARSDYLKLFFAPKKIYNVKQFKEQ